MRALGLPAGLGRLEQREQHGELLGRFDRVRQVGRHIEEGARFEGMGLSRQGKLALAGQDLNQGVLRGGVLGQLLARIEAEYGHIQSRAAVDDLGDHGSRLDRHFRDEIGAQARI